MLAHRQRSSSALLHGLRGCMIAVLVLAGCSSDGDTASGAGTPAETVPGRLALEPGVDPSEVNELEAVPSTTSLPPAAPAGDTEDEPSEALASTEDSIAPASADESTPDDTADVLVPSDFESLVVDLIDFVEAERGHRFDQAPTIERLDEDAFRAAIDSVISADGERFREELAGNTIVQRALGVLTPEQDLASVQASFGDAGITALYDPFTGVIHVRDEPVSPLLRTSLIFELTRALDDQEFGIRRAEGQAAVAEVEWSRAALVHGSATEITNRYRDTMTDTELAEEQQQVDALPRNVSLSLFTSPWLELQFGRQFYGEVYVSELWAAGQSAVDAALANPPSSSEVLIAADAADAAAPIAEPPADGSIVESGVWGQAGWIALFTEFADPEDAEALTSGWGGDAFVAWETGTASCVRLHLAADTPEDLDRYAEALATWAEAGDRQLFFPTADLIRVTACA